MSWKDTPKPEWVIPPEVARLIERGRWLRMIGFRLKPKVEDKAC